MFTSFAQRLVRILSLAAAPVRWVLQWIGQHELRILLSLTFAALGIWIFVTLADEVRQGNTISFDTWALRALRSPDDQGQPRGPEWMIEVARDVTALGGLAVLLLIILSVAGFLWLRKLYGPLILVGGASFSGLLLSLSLKELFDRPRPDAVPHLSQVFTSSFPSGHSMLAATVYLTLGVLLGQFVDSRVLRAYFLLVALGLTLLVGLSRLYLGVHYPTDVLAGWSAGLAWALLCSIITLWLQKRGVVAGNIVGD